MVAGLVAGAQVTCLSLLPSMLVWVWFHSSAGGKLHAVMFLAFTVALAYFGMAPFPTVPPLEWARPAIAMTVIAVLNFATVPAFLIGGKALHPFVTEPQVKREYDDEPEGLLSDASSCEDPKSYRRARELSIAGLILGWISCVAAAVISGGARDLCLLSTLPLVIDGYAHWLRSAECENEKIGAMVGWVCAAVTLGLGIPL